jgi:predicted nuclease of predicted toxin-antitoxin system
MKVLFDHDVPDELGYFLRQLGHEVHRLREELPTNTPDAEVLAHAARQGCLLLTCNRDDYLKLASYQAHAGIIILIRRRSRVAERAALLRLLQRAGREALAGNINFA